LAGCAVSTSDTVVTSPSIVTGAAEEETRTEDGLPNNVAIVPFTNGTQSEFAYEVVRRTMSNHFATKNYRWLHWKDVDNRLVLSGLETPDMVNAKTPGEVASILGVDGLIYGNITHYDKTFAGIYSQIAVGVELRFVKMDGEVIWEVKDVQRSHAGGISTSPVGLLMNALAAAKHLYGDVNLYRASDELGRDLAEDMPEPAFLSQRRKPRITNVIHSGVGQYLKYGDTLEVALEGDPGMTAAAVVDGLGIIDLNEEAPGQYVGKISIDRSVNLKDVVVTGRLQDDFSQTASWISPYGLLNIDNTPPGVVNNLAAESREGEIYLSWTSPADDDIASYTIGVAQTETGAPEQTFESANSEYSLGGVENFKTVYVSVNATDRAGNAGAAMKVSGVAAPDPRFGSAGAVTTTLPSVISGVLKMTAAGSPYYLNGDSRVGSDGVLLIEPGTQVMISPRAKLTVLGELHMFGTAARPVTASDVSGQGFSEFLVLQSALPVTVKGLNTDGAGIPIQIGAGNPLIADCNLENSQFNGIVIRGSARPVIRNCLISGAMAAGVIIEGQSQPTLTGNRFVDNQPFHVQNGSSYTVDASNNTFDPPASQMNMLGDIQF
jgi:parallel beta-helix repeat protein